MTQTPRARSRNLRAEASLAGRMLLAACAAVILVGCAQSAASEDTAGEGAAVEGGQEQPEGAPEAAEPTDENEPPTEPRPADATDDGPAQAAEPAGLQIPSIDVDEDQMVALDIMADGRLEEPSGWNDVGWFSGGSMPGEAGATVIAAHVDSPTGPAVFYRLLEMTPGEEVTVVDAEGQEHLYRVDRTADFPKDEFPTREVFGATPEDELRLITCTGDFDDETQRHADNRVVFASRVG